MWYYEDSQSALFNPRIGFTVEIIKAIIICTLDVMKMLLKPCSQSTKLSYQVLEKNYGQMM